MKKLIATFFSIVVITALGGCASTDRELTVPNKPQASNGKSDSKEVSGQRQTMLERHAQHRQNYISRH